MSTFQLKIEQSFVAYAIENVEEHEISIRQTVSDKPFLITLFVIRQCSLKMLEKFRNSILPEVLQGLLLVLIK